MGLTGNYVYVTNHVVNSTNTVNIYYSFSCKLCLTLYNESLFLCDLSNISFMILSNQSSQFMCSKNSLLFINEIHVHKEFLLEYNPNPEKIYSNLSFD